MLKFVLQCAARYPQVKRLVLFGSRARGDAGKRSDFDIAVVAPTMTHPQWAKFSIEIKEHIPTLCGIDLVHLSEETPAPLQEQIQQQGVIIYDQAA